MRRGGWIPKAFACAAMAALLFAPFAARTALGEEAVPAPLLPGFGALPPGRQGLEVGEVDEGADPSFVRQRIYENGRSVDFYLRDPSITMGSGDAYAKVEGVTTFRGNNYRDNRRIRLCAGARVEARTGLVRQGRTH